MQEEWFDTIEIIDIESPTTLNIFLRFFFASLSHRLKHNHN